MSLLIEHDLSGDEMVKAFAWTARAEGVDAELEVALHKSLASAPHPDPEKFVEDIERALDTAFKVLAADVADSIDRWMDMRYGVRKAGRAPGPYLTQQQVDELVALIRSQFRMAIRASVVLREPQVLEERWRAMGIIAPNVRVMRYFDDAFVAGRLYDVVTNNMTYAQMRDAAAAMRMSRALELSLGAVRRQVGAALMRFTDDLTADAEDTLIRVNNERVQEIVAKYLAGNLKQTGQNRVNLTPEEVARTETSKAVTGWRQLATELRNRMLSVDAGRDWHRVAASQVRYALNMGTLTEMAQRGVAYVQWRVMDNACDVCRGLFLETDGTPRRFPMATVMSILEQTGGTNAGRARSDWLATALPHPWCRCVPRPVGT